ncbi:protein PARALOG OF AIPP2-like isoform X2 [Cornus florida]|uniref:protein PARALOG OF AIPP2-like isoform X2 n=1 Tax=Cornus florida TaxID=4283 RepID=UPI002899C888|nr:protein PARALOG OF AIPP2-like isoform X2 [Cornus florida]
MSKSVMVKRKERNLKKLYNVTEMITRPEITPVLRGKCRMQGPIDEADYEIQSNTVSSQEEKGFGCFKSGKFHKSGTCNVCSTPCSSCLHINQTLMGSKADEFYDETYRGSAFSQYSVNDVAPPPKSSAFDCGQHTASEASNLFIVNSCHDSFSENAESKASLRTSDVSNASEDVEMSSKLSSGESAVDDQLLLKPQCSSDQRDCTNKFGDPKGSEGYNGTILSVSGANDAKILAGYNNGNVEREYVPHSLASTSILVSEGFVKTVQTDIGCLNMNCDVEGSHSLRRCGKYSEKCIGKVPPTVISTELSSPKVDVMGISPSTGMDDGASSAKVQNTCSHPPSDQTLSYDPKVKNLEDNPRFHLEGELPELTKDEASDIVFVHKSASYKCGDTQNSKVSLIAQNSEASGVVSLNLESETGNAESELPAEALNSSERMEEDENVKEYLVSSDGQETSLQSQPMDESDESDIASLDVKVCDICGDAGREDLLAVCSTCSDGAEHIYCMRDTLDKVPEGDWLCEECKFDEKIENQKQVKFVIVDGNERNQSSGQVITVNANLFKKLDTKDSDVEGNKTIEDISSAKASVKRHADNIEVASAAKVDGNERNQVITVNANLFKKLDTKDSDVEGNKTIEDVSSAKASGKRHADNIEVASAAKRQSLEPFVLSPKMSSPSRIAALSRDCSSKNLDREKVKLAQQSASGPPSVFDTPETACSPTIGPLLQTPRGIFMKSSSFSSSNAKPKVKLVDEVVLQKQKSAREHASLDMKKGSARLMGKSISFKSANSSRPNASELKVKMLSPKFSHGQDLKGLKKGKNWNSVERKSSFRSERPFVNSATVSTTRVDQKLASHGETYPVSCGSNNHELKTLQSDSKLTTSSKLTSHLARLDSEMPVALGEIKRQSSCSPSIGASLPNESSSSLEQKPNQISPKDDPSSSISFNAERPFCNVNRSLQDELPCPQEPLNLGDKIKENSLSWLRTIMTGGRSVACQKCKEIGHSAQFCTVDSPRPLAVHTSTARNSGELMHGGNKLKAAIEAALLKKPGIGRKNRDPYQSDDLSMSSTNFNCERASQNKLSIPGNMRTADEIQEGQALLWNSTADSCKKTTVNSMKQFSAVPTEAVSSKTRDTSDGKPCTVDLPCQVSAVISSILKMSAIPEHQCIWQVLEVVNKFPHKVLLNEVPRMSIWPIQFQERGVKEDNIGLYFFAKDMESYEKSYKILLESMAKCDLALKGNINDVELLIFPSNNLPDKSQRWNTMFFLWGVFRAKRVNCSQRVPGSPNKFFIPRDVPSAIMSLPDNICSLGPIDKKFSAHEKSCDVALASKAPASRELSCLSSETNGDCVIEVSSFNLKGQCAQANVGQQDCRLDSASLSRIQTISELLSPGMNHSNISLEKHVDTDCELDNEFQLSVQVPRIFSGSNERQMMLMHWDAPLDRPQILSDSFKKLAVGAQEVGAVGSAGMEKIILSRVNSSKDQVKYEEEDGSVDTQAALERVIRDPTSKELNCWQLNHRGCLQVDPTEAVCQPSASISQTTPLNDVNILLVAESASKKQKTGLSGLYDYNSCTDKSSSEDGFASEMHGVGTSFPIKEDTLEETVIPQDSGNTERYFFPVDPPPMKDFGLGDSPIPFKVLSSKDGDRVSDVAPNLELALGGEMIPSKQGILHFLKVDNKDQAQPPENFATKAEDDVSASLSLSLSFSLPVNEQASKPVLETQKLVQERRHANTSHFLFGDFSDK